MPHRLTSTPTTTATSTDVRKLRLTSWATAFGTIIRALISSSPTTRIETTTVTAVSTASTMLRPRTGSPTARAYSGSLATANSLGASTVVTTSTTTASAANVATSLGLVVVMAPNR